MKTLNAVMIVKNEERCLGPCLDAIRPLADRIVVADTGSTDRTIEIAKSFQAEICHFTWCDDFSAARNFALDHSHSDWNLILDADEILVKGAREDLMPYLSDAGHLGAVEIQNAYLNGTELCCGINYTTRLLPAGVRFTGRIHEQADSLLPRIPIPLFFRHDGYLQPHKDERNLPLLLEELKSHPDDPYYLYQLGNTYRGLNDWPNADHYLEAFYNCSSPDASYRNRGVTAYLYTLMERRDWERALTVAETEWPRLSVFADFTFACGIFYMKLVLSDPGRYLSRLPMIETSYLRCLEIGEVPEHGATAGTGSFRAAYNLGTWYEVSGNLPKALHYYEMAASMDYQIAVDRVTQLKG